MEIFEKERSLREEADQLKEALRGGGRNALTAPARTEAFRRLHAITAEIDALSQPEPQADPLDALTLPELQALYAEKRDEYTGSRDVRKAAELTRIDTMIQRLKTEGDAEDE